MAKESSASRRARVKFQLRDKKGRWIEMGRGVKWYSPQLKRNVSGTVMGVSGRNAVVNLTSEPKGKDGKPQQVTVKGSDIEVISNKATLGGRAGKMAKVATKTAKKAELVGGREDKESLEKRSDLSPVTEKPNAKKGSQADSDKEDDETPEVDEPDVADLEDINLDEDLDEDEDADADEDVDTSPTDIDALEATIEELEAVVEEVSSGDLDDAEIDAKLAEEVYSVYGKDGKEYDLDVKKDVEGAWNYRLRDSEGRTRKVYALIPADENDSVDAGAKLDAAMNPKTKAKATTAKPKAEENPVPETEAPKAEEKAKPTAPEISEPVPEGEQDELFPAPKSKAPGKNATDMKKELDALPDDTRIHFSDAMGENSEVYQKVTTNPDEGKPKTLWAKVGIDESDDDGRLEVLDGSSYKKPGQLEKEREALNSAGIAKKHAGRKFETDSAAEPEAKGHMAPVKHRPPIKGDNKAGSDPDAAPESEDEEEEPLDDDDFETDEEIWLDAQETNRWNTKYNFNREQKEAYEDAIRAAEAEAGPEAYKDRPKWAETIKRHFDAAAEAKASEDAPASEDTSIKATKDGNKVKLEGYELTTVSELEEGDSYIPIAEVDGKGQHAKYATMDAADRVTGTTNKYNSKEVAVNANAVPVNIVTKNSEATYADIRQSGGQAYSQSKQSHGRGTWRSSNTQERTALNRNDKVLKNTPEVREALAKAGMNVPTPPKEMSTAELKNEASSLHGQEAEPNEDGRPANTPRQKRLAALEKELDARAKTPISQPEEQKADTTPETAPEAPQDAPEAVDTPEEQKADTAPENPAEAADAWTPAPAPATTPAVIAQTDEEADAAIAALMAEQGIERTEPVTMEGEKYPPTRQQQDVIDAVMAGKDTVVQAKAGAGKTTTLQAIAARVAEASPDKKIVYVAFNSSVQKEAEARMPGNVEARTGHSIGFGWVGKDVNDRYKGENGHVRLELDEDVAKHIGITGTYKGDPGSDDSTLYPEDIAAAAMLTVDKFAYNAEDDINEDHLPDSMFGTSPEAKTAVIDAANKIWADVNAPDGKIKLTQDHMRKMWALSRPDFGQTGAGLRRKADMLFIDEAQDTPPVLAKVIADQKMQKVIVGDADQAIYAFSGATDFLSKAEKDLELPLNRSWRFGAPVADAGNRFLQLLGSKGRVVGGGNSKISEGKMQDADAVLVRTNAGALAEMVEEGARGRIVGVEKKTIDKFNSAADTMDWLKSKNKGQTPIPKPKKVLPELAAYKDWNHVERENEKGDKPNLAMYVRLDGLYGSNGIRDALKNVVAVDSKSPGKASKGIGGNLNGVQMDDNGKTTVAAGNAFMNKDDLKAVGFKFLPDPSGDLYRSGKNKGQPKKSWQATGTPEQREAMVQAFGKRLGVDTSSGDAEPITPDVIISTAHKAKGLEWGKVRIGGDFPQPKLNKATGKLVMPDPENLRLAYVAVTRAEAELDPGSLGYVYEHTKENGGTPEPADKPAEQNEVTEPPISAADDSDFVPDSDNRVADTEAGAAPEAPQAPEADEVADESVPEAAPEAPEPVEAPEPTPAPAATPEPVETPEESAPTDTTPDPATPVDGLDEDGLTPDEAAYVAKLNKAIADGYRTGMGNVQALGERLDEMYERGAARLRGEDPDAVPEAAPEVKPAEDKEPATPEAKEEVVPEAEEVVEEAPEPTPEAPAEAEAEPVGVAEAPAEDGPQGDASDGEEAAEGGPTDLDGFEATASELFETFTDAQKTPRTPAELQDILDEEVYLLVGEDGTNYEFGLSIDDKGKWSYVLSDDDGNELERYNVVTVPSEEAGQKAFERVNGSQESETTEEAPVDPADATPEAEEEPVADADRIELDPADVVADPEAVPEPAPMPVVEDTTAPEEQTPVETPEVEDPEVSEEGTAPAEPKSAPVSTVVAKAGNYPDGTQIKDARTSEVIQKTNGKWHVAGKPNKAASPDTMRTPVVTEMPKQPAESFVPFEGIDTVTPGDIIVTKNGEQASVIGTREGRLVVLPHNLPAAKKAMRPNTVFADPEAVTGINKFDTPRTTPAASKPKSSTYSGNRGRTDLTIMDGNGYETKIGDTVMTAVGQGEVVSVRPSSGPQGSVQVRLANGDVKMFRSNKFTNAAGAESLVGDDPATMEVGAQGTGADGRKFLVGKGNKPIHKGDRVELADGRVGTVSGIYAGVKSANIKMEDGSTLRKKVSTLDAIDYVAPEKGPDAPEDGPDGNGGASGGDSAPDAPESGPETGAEAPAAPAFSLLDALRSGGTFRNLSEEDRAAMQESMRQFASRISDRLPEGMTAEAQDTFEDGELISTYDGRMANFTVAIQRGEERVGIMSRTVRWGPQSEKLEVHHDSFNLLPQEQNKGVAKVVLDESEAYYRSLGVSSIHLKANIDVGGYAWARAGFDFAGADDMEDFVFQTNERFKTSSWLEHTPAEKKMFDGLAARATEENFENGTHPTPFEFSQLGYDGSDNWLGKRIMLHSEWLGAKSLEPVDAPEQDSATPEVPEAVTPEAVTPEFVFGENDTSYAVQDLFEGTNSSPERLAEAAAFFDDPKEPFMAGLWQDGAPLATLMRGDGSPKELAKASQAFQSFVFAGAVMEQYHASGNKSFQLQDMRDMWFSQHDQLQDRYNATLSSLTDAVGERGDLDSPEIASYDGSADFSSFDWSTSKFNPSSEKAKSIGDLEDDGSNAEGIRRGSRVRNKRTGEYGFLSSVLVEKSLADRATGESEVSVIPSTISPTLTRDDQSFTAVPWAVEDVESVADVTWEREALDFSDAAGLDDLASRAQEAYPGLYVALDGITLTRGIEVMNNLSKLVSKYPMLQSGLQSVSTGDAGGSAMAYASHLKRERPSGEYGPSRMVIDNTKSDAHMTQASRKSSDAGWFTPVKRGDETAHTIYHETAHILDTISGEVTEEDILEILKSAYPNFEFGNRLSLRQLMIRGKMAKYATADGKLDVGELIAEAFADAELNASEAWPLSKLLHKYLLERLQEG